MTRQRTHRSLARAAAAVTAVLWVCALSAPTAAQAGSYTVLACDAAGVFGYAGGSWLHVPAPNMGYTLCPSNGDQYRGISTRIDGPVPNGTSERAAFYAPAGTSISHLRWSGRLARGACHWAVGMRALPSNTLTFGWDPGKSCPSTSFDTGGAVLGFSMPPGTTALAQYVQCGASSCDRTGTMHTRSAEVRIDDPHLPDIGLPAEGLLAPKWVGGDQQVTAVVTDNVGVANVSASLSGLAPEQRSGGCNPTLAKPGADLPLSARIGTRDAPNGTNTFRVAATDCAGNTASSDRTIRVDNVAPDRVRPVVTGGDGWRRLNAFTVRWTNSADGLSPITRTHYEVCTPAVGCERGLREGSPEGLSDIRTQAAGDSSLTVQVEDEAGNRSPVSDPVHLRFDPDPPELAFEDSDPADPLRVRVRAADEVSGVVGGEIEIRSRGASSWQSLVTSVEGEHLLATVDDERFATGIYDLRARAVDQAGNERSVATRPDGSAAGFQLPARVSTRLRAGVKRITARRVTRRRRGKRQTVLRKVVRYRASARARLGSTLVVAGALTNPDGQPIDFAPIEVLQRRRNGFLTVGAARTDARGRFTYRVKATRNRGLVFRYAGTPRVRGSVADFNLQVRAAATMRASRRRLLNGQAVLFGGRVGGSIPPSGKLIEIQAFFRGRWRTISTARTLRTGKWRFSYRFGATTGVVSYRFRLCVPLEGGFPFARGCSRTVRVTVRGL